ncbi:hypothetical protein CVT25_015546 [Psilocybe cyanescens]|uniref:MutL C-terminal dimerisation domain-containing protein n=1 Tax=Psilocybe cyanescens TaxID=93625 RepID=A0A409WI87_PSICY|nr:hypothetical protein CVT25_015546 [Psilocybe cyanescens]
MSETLPAIERLPLPTQAKLRSAQILTTFPQIISELLQNSLDADATHIDIGIDCKQWMCWVRDNGHGITKDDLELMEQAGNAGRYNSSKDYVPRSLNSQSTFGFRGEGTLASAADIACLEIFSRTSKSRNTWFLLCYNLNVIDILKYDKGGEILYKGPAVRWKRESPGTVVCIRDIFYNLPVRRRSHTPPIRTWELVRQEIETYSLVFPRVSFTLEDSSRSGDTSQHKDRIIRIPQAQHHYFGKISASLWSCFDRVILIICPEPLHMKHVEQVETVHGTMKIEGFISLMGALSKVYDINRHPIINNDLNRIIDHEFASSSFGKNALDEEGERNTRSTTRRSPRKTEKKPVYVINISIASEEVDNCLGPDKTAVQFRNKSDVTSLLASTVRSFLEKHNFLNRNRITAGHSRSPSLSPRKRKKLSLYDSGYAEPESLDEISALTLNNDCPLLPEPLSDTQLTLTDGIPEEIVWTDPRTGECFVIDSLTGNSYRQIGGHSQTENDTSNSAGAVYEGGRRTLRWRKPNNVTTTTSTDFGQESVPPWLQKALESNRAYPVIENRIPSVYAPLTSYHTSSSWNGSQQCNKHESHVLHNPLLHEFLVEEIIDPSFGAPTQQFTKHDLRRAEIINQVDRKFIACRILRCRAMQPQHDRHAASQSGAMVVLIDQHAADERVRVERFLKELFLGFLSTQDRTKGNPIRGVLTRELNPPRLVLLTQHEALMIKRSQDTQDILWNWGVRFAELSKVMPNGDGASESGGCIGYSQLLVSSIPEVVSDKLLQGDELRDFIKGFLGQIQRGELFPETGLDLASKADQDEFFWLKAVRRCPRGLLDLINSKACRGAIMFNDTLSITQCKHLVQQLSDTAFPFQCAHGRPSLVPLAETGMLQTRSHKSVRLRNDWARFETMTDA